MTKIRRRQRCPKCGSLNIILWGSRDGRQRYRCKDCERSFVRCNENVSQNNRFVWFRRWVLGKQTLMDIAKESGYSERHLRRWFDGYLYKAPLWTIKRRAGIRMLVDGTWLDKEHCLIVYRDNASKSTVYYRFASAEKEYEIIKDLEAFKQLKISISSFTIYSCIFIDGWLDKEPFHLLTFCGYFPPFIGKLISFSLITYHH